MKLWRIATETRKYPADDLSGAAAAVSPGRWNDGTQPVVYCATTIAIAVLETAAHVNDADLPLNRYLVRIDVPDEVWALHEQIEAARLPATWDAIPAGKSSVQFGSAWLASNRSPILLLPSVILPEEFIALINPQHSTVPRISATVVRPFEYNRFFRQ